MTKITIDGMDFTAAVTKLQRSFSVLDSENTGRTLAGDMQRDVIGTYYNYTVDIDTSFLSRSEYDTLYEKLSSPDEFHTMVLPYGQTTYSFKAYVTSGKDELKRIDKNGNLWDGISVNFIAKSPKRRA